MIPPKVLADRLAALVEHALLTKTDDPSHMQKFEADPGWGCGSFTESDPPAPRRPADPRACTAQSSDRLR
jgi:hypothetical protein